MALVTVLDDLFFDDVFDDMNREIARMHHDMRCAMNRITPRDYISGGGQPLKDEVAKLKEPIVTNDDGSKELCLKYDLAGFKPEEISVKTADGAIQVDAKHEEKTDNSKVYHHFSRYYTLPKGVDAEKVTSSLSKDGVLVVKGPVSAPALTEK